MYENSVLVAGAGPTGLTMAIEMRRMGIPVRIFDMAEQPAQWSQALVVQARTLEQFERYGIADTFVQQGRKLSSAELFSDGKKIVSFGFDRVPGRYPFALFIPQSETERLLLEHLRLLGGDVERGVELVSFVDDANGVTAQLRHKDGRVESAAARWLVGSDGAHSVVRRTMGVAFEGDTVGLNFSLADLELQGPGGTKDELRVHLLHGDVIFMARLTETVHRVIVVSHAEQGKSIADIQLSTDYFQRALDRFKIDVKVMGSTWMTPFHINQRKAAQYRVGHAFLAGDASHIHSPVAGQGMNTGIQDAANLAWKIAAVANGANADLLSSYDEERGKVGDALLRTTSRGLSAVTSDNPIFEAIRDRVVPLAMGIPQVQSAAAGFVSETAIHYRHSSIVNDCGGDGELRAGDRMPNPDIGEGRRLLDGLRDGRHLVISVGVETELREHVPQANQLAFTSSESGHNPELVRILGRGGEIVAVRPDGYVGFRGGLSDVKKLNAYAELTGISSRD